MNTPLDHLTSAQHIDHVVRDCVQLVREEAAKKRGMSGIVIKGGLKLLGKMRPHILDDLFYSLLPSFIEELKPLYHQYQNQTQPTHIGLSVFLTTHASEVASTLLEVTDQRAERSKISGLVSIYRKLRPIAHEHIMMAVPALGKLLEHHISDHNTP